LILTEAVNYRHTLSAGNLVDVNAARRYSFVQATGMSPSPDAVPVTCMNSLFGGFARGVVREPHPISHFACHYRDRTSLRYAVI
jgi:hypothetical protein